MDLFLRLVCVLSFCVMHSAAANTCRMKTRFTDYCRYTGILLNCSHTGYYTVHTSQHNTEYKNNALNPNDAGNKIIALDLSFNRITNISSATFLNFTNKKHITSIFLNNNHILHIQNQAFKSFSHLCYLDISSAELKKMSLDEKAFNSLKHLEILNIKINNFQKTSGYPDKALSGLRSLRNLTIDIYEGFFFGNRFQKLTHLHEIHLIPKGGITFRHSSFLGLSESRITTLSLLLRNPVLTSCSIPHDLYCPFKKLTSLYMMTRCYLESALLSLKCFENRTMDVLSVTFNIPIAILKPVAVDNSVTKYLINICVKKLDLSNNRIIYMSFKFKNTMLWGCIEILYIAENYIYMPYSMAVAFYAMPNLRQVVAFSKLQNFADSKRTSPSELIAQSQQKEVYSALEIYFPPKLELLDCHNTYMHALKVNISVMGQHIKTLFLSHMRITFNMVRRAWFPRLSTLNISYNSADNLNLFQDMPQLETMIARNSRINYTIDGDRSGFLFRNLARLANLDLSENNLHSFHSSFFQNQKNSLTSVILDYNDFSSVSPALSFLHNLEHLSYRYNKFYSLSKTDIKVLQKMNNLKRLYLEGNPISCTCSVRASLLWMKMHKHLLTDIQEIKCVDSADMLNDLLGESSWRVFVLKCISKDWVIVSAILLSISLITVTTTILVLKYRIHLDYLMIRLRNRWRGIKSQKTKNHFAFDVFISYCETDVQWVCNTLHDTLSPHGFNVSLHAKNFLPGDPIADQVLKYIDDSRKVLFVVTYEFLQCGWSSYEIQMAVTHAFHSHRQAMIVVLIKDAIPLTDMPEELKNIWWTIQYLRWPNVVNEMEESKFWNELESILRENL